MKKYFVLALILGVALFSYGCQTAQQSSTPSVPASTAAASCSTLASTSLMIDNIALGTVGIAGLGIQAVTNATTPTYTAPWWTVTFTYGGSVSVTTKFRIWSVAAAGEITTIGALNAMTLADVDQFWMSTSWVIGDTTMTFGTDDNPLKFTGVGTDSLLTKSVTGPITLSGVDPDDGTEYSISITYSTVGLSASGWPNGTISFSVSSGGSVIISGDIVCDGTSTATLTFTSGYSGSYTIDLTGSTPPVAASL